MYAVILTEGLALKLAVFGWSLILVWLCYMRGKEVYNRHPNASTMRAIHGKTLVLFSSLLAVANIVRYFMPLVDNVVFGDFSTRHYVSYTGSMVFELLCISIAIDKLAYSRTYKLYWEAGWFLFVHVMVWGRLWITG